MNDKENEQQNNPKEIPNRTDPSKTYPEKSPGDTEEN